MLSFRLCYGRYSRNNNAESILNTFQIKRLLVSIVYYFFVTACWYGGIAFVWHILAPERWCYLNREQVMYAGGVFVGYQIGAFLFKRQNRG